MPLRSALAPAHPRSQEVLPPRPQLLRQSQADRSPPGVIAQPQEQIPQKEAPKMTPLPESQIAPPPPRHLKIAICILYWSVGLVIRIESSLFVFSASRGHAFAKSGMPQLIRPMLGGAEIIAALLFLIPPARTV